MSTAASILAELKSKGTAQARKIYARHGIAGDRVYGTSYADLKLIAKRFKKQQALAMELYDTGVMEAMYLAGMIAEGARMTAAEIEAWAEAAAGMQMISEYTVPWVAVENAAARELALEWMHSKKEHIAASGWCTYSGLVALRDDAALDLAEIAGLLDTVVREIDDAANRVRYTMNGFVIDVGAYVTPLAGQAKAAARTIGKVHVEMGETECKVPLATEYIARMEVAGRAGRKRKTIRC